MTKIEYLIKQAKKSAEFRGHKMKKFEKSRKAYAFSECIVCGKTVVVTDKPLPNECCVMGEAVAVYCR